MKIEDIKKYTKKFSVLYIEDDKNTRASMLDLLEFFFKDANLATQGKEGLDKFYNKNYDIVITDLIMPKMDGFEMIKLMKQKNKNISIIITTALSKFDNTEKLKDLGITAYLAKPILTEKLKDVFYTTSKTLYEQSNEKTRL